MAKRVAGATYTDSELLDLFRSAYADIAAGGQSYKIGTREYTAADLDEIRNQIEWLENRIDTDASGLISNPIRRKRTS